MQISNFVSITPSGAVAGTIDREIRHRLRDLPAVCLDSSHLTLRQHPPEQCRHHFRPRQCRTYAKAVAFVAVGKSDARDTVSVGLAKRETSTAHTKRKVQKAGEK